MSDFVNLHTHTTYSIMDSLIKPADLFLKIKELGQSAVGITDHGTLSSAWDSLKYAKEAGVKLIMGEEFYFVDDISDDNAKLRHVILLATNAKGYKNLLALSFEGFNNKIVMFKKVIPRIDWNLLEKYSDGLICTTACGGGILSQLINTRKIEEARNQAKRLKSIFGDRLALEIQPHRMRRVANLYKDYEDQFYTNNQLIKIGDELNIKIIVAVDSHYLAKEDYEAHDCLLAIGSGQPITSGNRLKYSNDFWVKSRDEVIEGLKGPFAPRAEEFCDNTLYFANMCEDPVWIDPKYSNPAGKELPEFPVHDQDDYDDFKNWLISKPEFAKMKEDASYLRYLCDINFDSKVPSGKEEEYKSRLNEEFDVIEHHDFSSYMLIVADFISWCRKNNIRVGAGRGSIGGAMIGYLTNIHEADPIKYNLIFARFHNKEKTSFPDIDVDIAPSGRDDLHRYLREKYGEDHVAHVSNVNTMTPKVFARDIARAFQFGGDQKTAVTIGTAIADSIPKEYTKSTIEEVLEKAPLFAEYANSEKYGALKKFALQLNGKAKAWSTHAAGLIIGKRPLVEFVPLRRDKDGAIAIEYEKERAEANGLVKMDTLGLETLDIITNTYKLIKEQGKQPPPETLNYDEYDKKTYDLISKGDTLCVFQLGGSAGTIDLCRKIKPKSIEDISLINALARPSARDMRADFIEVRDGRKPIELLHPKLQRSFGGTYGFGLFEECLMFLAGDVAGWDLHDADRLRKLTKEKGKNPKKVAKWKKEFIEGSVKNGVEETIAIRIWDEVVDKFQGYGFNLSHSILYSMISYHTAYLKAHFPLEFLTANLMSEVGSNSPVAKDNINMIKSEIRKLNVNIVSPDINNSQMTYKIINDKTLITGLDALKFIGKHSIPEILAKRPFSSFEDFLIKVDGRKVTAPAVQALAASGCLDSFGMTRKMMFLYASDFKKKLQVWSKKANKSPTFNYPWPEDNNDWTLAEKYALERKYIGEGLSANKIQAYPGFFNASAPKFIEYPLMFPDPGEAGEHYQIKPFLAEVKSFFEFKVKKEKSKSFGKPMAKVVIEDPWGHQTTMTVFPIQWASLQERISTLLGNKATFEAGVGIHATGQLNWYEGDISIIFDELLRCVPPPPLPADLKHKKVTMKSIRSSKKTEEMNIEELLEEIEDELTDEGLSLDDDDSFDIDTESDEEYVVDGFN